jgi:hypothetical protein
VRSSSPNNAATVSGSTIEAVFGASTSTVEVKDISSALAVGSRVAIKSREDETPRIAIDFAVLKTGFTVVLLSFSDHPQVLTRPVNIRSPAMANQPQMRLNNLRGMPLWCGRSGTSANQSTRESEILRKPQRCG